MLSLDYLDFLFQVLQYVCACFYSLYLVLYTYLYLSAHFSRADTYKLLCWIIIYIHFISPDDVGPVVCANPSKVWESHCSSTTRQIKKARDQTQCPIYNLCFCQSWEYELITSLLWFYLFIYLLLGPKPWAFLHARQGLHHCLLTHPHLPFKILTGVLYFMVCLGFTH